MVCLRHAASCIWTAWSSHQFVQRVHDADGSRVQRQAWQHGHEWQVWDAGQPGCTSLQTRLEVCCSCPGRVGMGLCHKASSAHMLCLPDSLGREPVGMQLAAVAAGCPVQAVQRWLAADVRSSWGVPVRVVQGPGCSCSPQRGSPGADVHRLGSHPQRLHSKTVLINAADAVDTRHPPAVQQ